MVRFLAFFIIISLFGADSGARVDELYKEAKTAQSQGDVPGAIRKYEEILRIAPTLGPAYNNLGALYFRERAYDKAAHVLEQGLKVDPAMASASALLGISLFELGEYGKARLHLEAALKSNPHDANAQIFLAKDLARLGVNDEAARLLQKLAVDQPKNQEIWYLLAKLYMKLSEQALTTMNSIDPDSVIAHELSAEVMEAMNNYDGAVVELKKAVEIAPQRSGTHYKLGDAYLSLAQLDSALDQFRTELTIDPGSCQARWKIGSVILLNNGDPNEALEGIEKAIAACPHLAGARLDRARALMKLSRNQEALQDLEAAVKTDPAEPSTHFLLAKALRALGRTAESQTEMQTFKTLDDNVRAGTAERAQEVIKNKQSSH